MVLWNYAAFDAVDHDFTFQYAQYDQDAGGAIYYCVEHGWPWPFARRDFTVVMDWNLRAGLLDLYPLALLADAVVAVAISAVAGWMYERWRRKHARWYQVGVLTMLVATLLFGWTLQVVLQHRHVHDVLQRADPSVGPSVVGLQSVPKRWGPVSLAGRLLPTSSQYAKPLFISVNNFVIAGSSPHPGPVIKSIVELDPAACRVAMTDNQIWEQQKGLLDWMYAIPVQDIYCIVEPDGTLEPLTKMPHLRRLWINWPPGGHKARLAVLGRNPKLELLAINGKGTQELGDEDLSFLKSLTQLRVLAIGPSQITAATLTNIARMAQLRTLCLPGCPLTDEDLQRFSGLVELRRLELDSSHVSDAAVQQLKSSCPWLQVVRLNELPP